MVQGMSFYYCILRIKLDLCFEIFFFPNRSAISSTGDNPTTSATDEKKDILLLWPPGHVGHVLTPTMTITDETPGKGKELKSHWKP